MATTTLNGSARKSLSEQIDRLDSILDGLADGLSGAVADAVRQTVGLAVQEAVKAVLTELLTNPAVLEKLGGNAPAATPKAPKADHVTRMSSQVNAWARAGWAKVHQACGAAMRGTFQAADTAWQHGRLLWTFRAPVLVAVAAGMLSGTAALMAGPWVAATAGTVAGFTAAATAQLALTLRRMLNRFTSCDAQD